MSGPSGPFPKRQLPGLVPRAKPPTVPVEVLSVTLDDGTHRVAKQTHAACVCGIDTWTVETTCGRALVVTQLARRNEPVSCSVCLSRAEPAGGTAR